MSGCTQYEAKTLRYLDGDLRGLELEDFRSHLESCENCRAQVETEQNLSRILRQSRPLYSAPASLRARVSAATTQDPSAARAVKGLGERAQQVLRWPSRGVARHFLRLQVLAPAVLTIALCLAFVPNIARHVRAASFIETAVATHRSYVAGSL